MIFLLNIILDVQASMVRKINKRLKIGQKDTKLPLYQDYNIDYTKIP